MTALRLMAAGALVVLSGSACRRPAPAVDGRRPPESGKLEEMDPLPFADRFELTPEIERRYDLLEFQPLGDPRFFFTLRVKKGWELRSRDVAAEELSRERDRQQAVPLQEVGPPEDDRVFVEVAYTRVPDGMTLDRFVRRTLESYPARYLALVARSSQDVVAKLKVLSQNSGDPVHDLLVRIDHQDPALGPMLHRIAVFPGPRDNLWFLVTALSPEAQYPKWKYDFGVAIGSFVLKNK